jgi:1-acyl-sn-glycerol-3-phosphate acyltransferase
MIIVLYIRTFLATISVLFLCFCLNFNILNPDLCYYLNHKILHYLSNARVEIIGVMPKCKNKLIILSNHYTILDWIVLANNLNISFNTIVKSDLLKTNQSLMQKCFPIKTFFRLHKFIPYIRKNSESGKIVKDIIVSKIRQNENVLLFPDGTSYIDGRPRDFKTGIFNVAVENNFNILPITIIYSKNIGTQVNTKFNIFDVINCDATIYIHPVCCGQHQEELKETVFKTINKPFQLME